jgi:GYD domain
MATSTAVTGGKDRESPTRAGDGPELKWRQPGRGAKHSRGLNAQGDATMPIYVLRGKYSSEALKGMIASPEDREAAIAKVVEKTGGRLLSYYLTFGDDDWLVIIDVRTMKSL